jgi:hypothetical protein
MAGRFAQAQAAQDDLVPGVPEILLAGRRASRWPWALALPADSLAHREAMDSNLVWEAPALPLRPRTNAQQQASLRRAQEMWRGAPPQARLRASSRQQEELAVAPEEHVDALAAWRQRLGLARD